MVEQHHDAVSVRVAVEMSGDDVTVLPEDGDQPLVVAYSHSSGASGKRQVPHWYVGYDVDLEQEVQEVFVWE